MQKLPEAPDRKKGNVYTKKKKKNCFGKRKKPVLFQQ